MSLSLTVSPTPWLELGAKSHGMKADPPWFKYECFLLSGWRDIVTKRNFNQNLSHNVTRMNKQTNEQDEVLQSKQ